MNKSEATEIMHEILAVLKESVIINGFSLDHLGTKPNEDFKIRIKCDLDNHSRQLIRPILDKRKLKIDLMKDTVVISSLNA